MHFRLVGGDRVYYVSFSDESGMPNSPSDESEIPVSRKYPKAKEVFY